MAGHRISLLIDQYTSGQRKTSLGASLFLFVLNHQDNRDDDEPIRHSNSSFLNYAISLAKYFSFMQKAAATTKTKEKKKRRKKPRSSLSLSFFRSCLFFTSPSTRRANIRTYLHIAKQTTYHHRHHQMSKKKVEDKQKKKKKNERMKRRESKPKRERESEKNQVWVECDVAIRFRCQMMSFFSFASSFTVHTHRHIFLRSLMSKCLLRQVVQPTQFCQRCQSLRIVRVRTHNNSSTPVSDTSHTSANKVICSGAYTEQENWSRQRHVQDREKRTHTHTQIDRHHVSSI